jgi:hypothetical protein
MSATQIPELAVYLEEDFVDLSLKMEALLRDSDGLCRFEARALYKDRRVGFAVVLGSKWEPQEIRLGEGTTQFYWGEAHLVSVGTESDSFIEALDQLYETNIGASQMVPDVRLVAVSLEGDPTKLESERLKIKMFFEHEVEDRNAEFYLNCDAEKSSVQFNEKDSDYRYALILALSHRPT